MSAYRWSREDMEVTDSLELLGGEAKAEPKEPRNEEELNPQKTLLLVQSSG